MRTEGEILTALEAAQEGYNRVVHTQPADVVRDASEAIKALRYELAETIGAGANPCPTCDRPPHAMRRRERFYEVGCLHCTTRRTMAVQAGLEVIPGVGTIPERGVWAPALEHRAQGMTARAAVTAWNDGDWLPAPEKPRPAAVVSGGV